MGRKNISSNNIERLEQEKRGLRIKNIRENELKMNKTQLAKEIGVSSQFLGLVEEGKGNLVYNSLKRLRNIIGHSADYILFGLDDNSINKAKELLNNYSELEITETIDFLKHLIILMRNI